MSDLLCDVLIEKTTFEYQINVWISSKFRSILASVEGVHQIIWRDGNKAFLEMDHRYDSGTVIQSIVDALDAEGLVIQVKDTAMPMPMPEVAVK